MLLFPVPITIFPMNMLLQTINQHYRISQATQGVVSQTFVRTEIPANTYLVKEDQYCRKLWFLASGALRTYHYRDGKDITSWFYTEGQFFSSWYGFYTQQPSTENLLVVADAVAYGIGYEEYEQLNRNYPDFAGFSRKLAEYHIATIDLFSKGIFFMDAKEKYDMFVEYFPEAFASFNLGHIASFLGISQETLSRIRKRK